MRAFVTGASLGGLGGATSERLVRDAIARGEEAKIFVCSTGARPEFVELIDNLRKMGADVASGTGDLTDPAVPQRLMDAGLKHLGGLDSLVSNAGLLRAGSMVDMEVADWDYVINLHTRAAWLLAKAAYDALRESRGAMVAVASMSGTFPHIGLGSYPMAKAALIMLCQTLSQEWGKDGIRVNSVSPGPIMTPLNLHYKDPEVLAVRHRIIPLGRLGLPEQVAGTIVYLLGPDAGFVTGENILIDGGLGRSGVNQIPGKKGTFRK
ncbi:MAG: SDR family oxidoreductase [Desulfobacterales bacterium]|nr:SDR family oxidoreductase [Desulfobacterales bacterium]